MHNAQLDMWKISETFSHACKNKHKFIFLHHDKQRFECEAVKRSVFLSRETANFCHYYSKLIIDHLNYLFMVKVDFGRKLVFYSFLRLSNFPNPLDDE